MIRLAQPAAFTSNPVLLPRAADAADRGRHGAAGKPDTQPKEELYALQEQRSNWLLITSAVFAMRVLLGGSKTQTYYLSNPVRVTCSSSFLLELLGNTEL